MREHKHRRMVRRIVAPPPFPGIRVKEPYLTSLWPHFHKQISVELNRQMCTVS